ncbi:MAG: hypothetical protein ACLFU5_08235, partial [Thermoplasmata archaeon]
LEALYQTKYLQTTLSTYNAMVELELEDEQSENFDCPECGQGWLVVDRDGKVVCQNCGVKFDRKELLKNIRDRSF